MDELPKLLKALDLNYFVEDKPSQDVTTPFKNPSRLPITQIHLEHEVLELKRDANLDDCDPQSNNFERQFFEKKVQIIPALHKSWLPVTPYLYRFEPYNFTVTKEENSLFLSNNRLFLENLNYLLRCNFHHFWCLVLFEPDVSSSLHSFLLNPIIPYEVNELDEEFASLYESVFTQFLLVYRRLITFKQSETEYMDTEVGLQFLLDKKFLNLPIVITLILLYEETNRKFVNSLVSLYFDYESIFRDKEVEERLNQVLLTLEMIGGHICGFEKGAVIVPIAIDERPLVFNIGWVYSVVNYLLNTVATLNILLKHNKLATEMALLKGIPYRLSFTYEHVYFTLYEMLNDRPEVERNLALSTLIYDEISIGRSEFIEVYNTFVTFCFDQALTLSGDFLRQQEVVETYLTLMTSALEDEYFICDYNERYNVKAQNEMFMSCTDIDTTRTDYLMSCITSFRRHNRLWKTLRQDVSTLNKAMSKYANSKKVKATSALHNNSIKTEQLMKKPEMQNFTSVVPSEGDIDEAIKSVVDMFPHLGDGFVLKCLEAYNYQACDVVSAILEENLPPHILDIPMDDIRIPPEPEPAKPVLAYRGKKPDYDDALTLLNDKTDMKKIKTFVLDGIQYTNEYDVYDDEYDDRQDYATVTVPDYGSEDILRFNPNHDDDVVSDTSYSENEYDDKGQVVEDQGERRSGGGGGRGAKGAFCEDPAVIRARREAKFRGGRGGGGRGGGSGGGGGSSQGRSKDVVGKPSGQGQDKNVLQNRQKKSVNKSSRANHNRKGGSSWKRSRGMIPS